MSVHTANDVMISIHLLISAIDHHPTIVRTVRSTAHPIQRLRSSEAGWHMNVL